MTGYVGSLRKVIPATTDQKSLRVDEVMPTKYQFFCNRKIFKRTYVVSICYFHTGERNWAGIVLLL